jgi:hypothetical protein
MHGLSPRSRCPAPKAAQHLNAVNISCARTAAQAVLGSGVWSESSLPTPPPPLPLPSISLASSCLSDLRLPLLTSKPPYPLALLGRNQLFGLSGVLLFRAVTFKCSIKCLCETGRTFSPLERRVRGPVVWCLRFLQYLH